jgi:hypothetical protein
LKLLLEVLLALFLHPIAFVLALLNIAGRDDLNFAQKVIWAIVCLFWGDRADPLHPAGRRQTLVGPPEVPASA